MILYSVSIALQPDVETEWLEWMRSVHIPDVLRTGCFAECHIYKVADPSPNEPSYVMQYRCGSLADYHRYRDNFAVALQKDHTDRFAGRFRAARQILQEVSSIRP